MNVSYGSCWKWTFSPPTERILDFLSRHNRRFGQFDLTPLI
jgi:hypothetical protein